MSTLPVPPADPDAGASAGPTMSVSEGRLPGMTDIALFHSVLGVRPGVSEAADRLRAEGHEVVVVDQYGGRVFDDYEEAGEFAQSIG